MHYHPLENRIAARRHRVTQPLYLNKAHPARAFKMQARVIADMRDVDGEFCRRLHYGRALGHGQRQPINCKRDFLFRRLLFRERGMVIRSLCHIPQPYWLSISRFLPSHLSK